MKELHYMIDIETTGVNKETDDILEVALVPIVFENDYWQIAGEAFHRVLHSDRTPQNVFAKTHMADLYKRCNEQSPKETYGKLMWDLEVYLHEGQEATPKYFMGWNASNFDLEFMFKKKILDPSFYKEVDGKEVLSGDVHYRVYEQTGALQLICDITGLDRKIAQDLAEKFVPNGIRIELPEGKQHDALYDCYSQINMMNGLIALGRSGFRLPGIDV